MGGLDDLLDEDVDFGEDDFEEEVTATPKKAAPDPPAATDAKSDNRYGRGYYLDADNLWSPRTPWYATRSLAWRNGRGNVCRDRVYLIDQASRAICAQDVGG